MGARGLNPLAPYVGPNGLTSPLLPQLGSEPVPFALMGKQQPLCGNLAAHALPAFPLPRDACW